MEYLRLRLRYERLRAAGRRSMEHLRLRLRYERLRAAGGLRMEHLRLRLRYERLRAAGRRSCNSLQEIPGQGLGLESPLYVDGPQPARQEQAIEPGTPARHCGAPADAQRP